MLFRFITITFLSLLLAGGSSLPVAPPNDLHDAITRNDAAAVERLLRELARATPEVFTRNNYDYLLARLLERRGAQAEAAALYQKVIARNAPTAGYALWRKAGLARTAGNAREEQTLLQQFIAQHPDHLLRERAIFRLSDSHSRGGQPQNALTTLRRLSGPRRDVLVKVAEAQLALKTDDAARASFDSLLATGASDDAALHASLGLDRIDEAAQRLPTEAERLRRARIYQLNRYFADARKHWLALVRDFPQSRQRAEALFQLGRGHFLAYDYAAALQWYQRVGDEFPQTKEGEQGFYYVGHCHQFSNDADRAIARYEAYLQAYPRGDFVGYAHLNAIDTLRTAGRWNEALRWAIRGQALNEGFFVVTSLFQQAKIRLTQEDYAAALGDLTALRAKNLSVRGQVATTNYPEVNFLRAYCLEKLGRFDEAATEYLALHETRNGAAGYYGHRATERLRALATNLRAKNLIAARRDAWLAQARTAHAQGDAATAKAATNQALRLATDEAIRNELFNVLRAAYAKLPGYQAPNFTLIRAGRHVPLGANDAPAVGTSHQTLADELLFLGLYDEGAPELLAATREWNYAAAVYCGRGNCPHRTYKYADPLLGSVPEDYRLELLPRAAAEIFYPMPFGDAFARHAVPRGIDPRFVLSIARQESTYNPAAKSNASARGLLQFIPETATQIAAQLGLRDFTQDDLYDPDTAILLGAQYLNNLFAEFHAPQVVAAAYNGSEDSVRRWLARAESTDPDRFVIETAKRETKDYVFKVMNYFRAYQTVHRK